MSHDEWLNVLKGAGKCRVRDLFVSLLVTLFAFSGNFVTEKQQRVAGR